MQSRRGIPVSPGIAIAKAVVLDNDEHTVSKRHVPKDKLQAEHDLVDAAIEDALKDLEDLRSQTASAGPPMRRVVSRSRGTFRPVRSPWRAAKVSMASRSYGSSGFSKNSGPSQDSRPIFGSMQ